jgi:hypothetical protein
LEGHTVDHSSQHPHVVASRTIHTLSGAGNTSKDIAATYHNSYFSAESLNRFYLLSNPLNSLVMNTKTFVASKSFATKF